MESGDVVLVTESYESEDYKLVGAVGVVSGRAEEGDWPEISDPVDVTFRNIATGDTQTYVVPAEVLRRVGRVPEEKPAIDPYDQWGWELHLP